MSVPKWPQDCYRLLITASTTEPPDQTIDSISKNTDKFPINLPIRTGTCKTLNSHLSKEILERNINSAYPLMHENALQLCCEFLAYKTSKGSDVEKKFYRNMSLSEFVNRLLKNRAVMFMGKADKYVLRSGAKGQGGWESIGTDVEEVPLVLEDCLSYDEVKLSTFLIVSSYSCFVNAGDRKNMAKWAADRSGIQEEGVIVGMIGPRLKKPNVTEYQEIVATRTQNMTQNGYGTSVESSLHKLFSHFYDEPCLDFQETIEVAKTSPTRSANSIFHNHLYHKRLAISIDTLLYEANYRARVEGTNAFVHIVGLGLGVWRASPHQERVYMKSFAQRLRSIGKNLAYISDVCFAWINQEKCGDCKNNDLFPIENHPLGGIRILINKRNPHEKLNENKLLVVSYAWDGNALAGNEYWSGKLGSSGDSAAALSTQIAEIHNAHINPKVCAGNLRVVMGNGEVVVLKRYQEIIRCKKAKRKYQF